MASSKADRTQPRKAARQDRSRATVDAILEASARLFAEGGLENITTNEIAERAGVSVGSLYQYFPSKHAILGELIDRHSEQTLSRLSQALLDLARAPIDTAVRTIVEILLEADTIDLNLHRLFLDKVPDSGRSETRQQQMRLVSRMLYSLLETRREELRPVDLEIASFVLVHAIENVTNAAVFEFPNRLKDPILVDEISALAARYLLR